MGHNLGRPKKRLTPADEQVVRHVLNLAPHQPFPRCPAKLKDKCSETCENHGTHKVCDTCRCERIAGQNTVGDKYGLGRTDLGHYGTGYCVRCEQTKRADHCERIWREHMDTMKNTGLTTVAEVENAVVSQAQQARQNIEVHEALTSLRDIMRDLKEKLESGDLTESGGKDGLQTMSDATRYKLIMQWSGRMTEIGKTLTDFSNKHAIPLDVLKLWQVGVMRIFQAIAPNPAEYKRACDMFKQVIAQTKNSEMMYADVEARGGMEDQYE